MEHIDRLIQAALDMRNSGNLVGARVLGERALSAAEHVQGRSTAIIHNELGFICLELGDSEDALKHYRASVALAPRAELASLGLFHTLANLGEWKKAFEEVVRFVSLCDSAEYRKLLAEVDDNNPAAVRRLIDNARAHLARWAATKPS